MVHSAELEDGAYVSFSEMKPWLELEDIAYHDNDLGKELYEVYANFRESRMAMYQKGKNRGYFPPKGKSKGKSKRPMSSFPVATKRAAIMVGKGFGGRTSKGSSGSVLKPSDKPGFTGCFICGDMGHDYKNCPKRSSPTTSPSRSANMIALVDDAFMIAEDTGNCDDLTNHIMAAKEAICEGEGKLRFAVVDTGATETVGSLDALDFFKETVLLVMSIGMLMFRNRNLFVLVMLRQRRQLVLSRFHKL